MPIIRRWLWRIQRVSKEPTLRVQVKSSNSMDALRTTSTNLTETLLSFRGMIPALLELKSVLLPFVSI